jgi:hypothetical protein
MTPSVVRVYSIEEQDRVAWGRFCLNPLVSPTYSHSINFSTFINHPVINTVVSVLTVLLNSQLKENRKINIVFHVRQDLNLKK